MQALLIVLAVILLLLILLSLPVTLDVRLEDSCRLTLRWLFLRFSLYPRPEKERKKAGPEKKEKGKKPDEKKPAGLQPPPADCGGTGVPRSGGGGLPADTAFGFPLPPAAYPCAGRPLPAGNIRRRRGRGRNGHSLRWSLRCGVSGSGRPLAAHPLRALYSRHLPGLFRRKSRVRLRAAFRLSPLTALCFLVGFILDVIKWKAGQPAPATVKEGVQK